MTAIQPVPAQELLLQQPPFRFVDALVAYDDTSARTVFRVPEEGPLLENGVLCSSGLMEHMAQSCAARVGYLSYLRHIPPRIGFIAQIKAWELFRFPKSGELLETDILVQYETMGITLADVTVRSAGELMAVGQFKTFLKEDD